MPLFGFLRMWVWGLLAVALWVGVVLLARGWSHNLPDPRPADAPSPDGVTPPPEPPPPSFADRVAAWRPGWDRATAFLAGAALLTLLGVGGGRALFRLFLPRGSGEPRHERDGKVRRVR